jgi:hypothetical protein
MPYDPNEVAILRQMIVEEQRKMTKPRRGKGKVGACGKSRKQGCECSDDEMEGGSLAALAGAFIRAVAPAVSRVATTASRGISSIASRVLPAARTTSTALVKYNPAQAAVNAARASAPSMVSRAASLASRGISNAARAAVKPSNLLSVGLPAGLAIYQGVDYEKQKAIAEGQAAEADRMNQMALADNQRQVDAEVEYLKEQQRLVDLDAKALQDENARREDEYQKAMAQQEQDRLRQVELERQYQAEADRQYQEMLLYNQQQIEKQIREQLAAMRPTYSAPITPSQPSYVPPSTATQPYVPPSQPSQPVANPITDPTAGMTAKQRAIYLSQQKKGRGKKVEFVGEGNAWIEALKDWNSASLHRDEMWCLPKKGSDASKEVREAMEHIKSGRKPPIIAPKPKKPDVVTYDDLMHNMGRDALDFWVDALVHSWAEKAWRIPMLPKPSREATLLKKEFPKMTNKQINSVLKGANDARAAQRKTKESKKLMREQKQQQSMRDFLKQKK